MIHSLSVAEKEGDNPCRFAVGTGSVESWEQYYVLEAASAEKKEQWVQSIKEILKGQFELLKALQGPRPRSKTFDVSTQPSPSQQNDSVAMINLSDDSEQEDEEYQPPPTPKTITFSATLPRSQGPTHTVAEPTPSTPPIQTRPFDLYCVAEDCAPPKDNEGIMYVRRGQIYDVLDSSSDWWLARLIKDVGTEGGRVCEQGWVPGSFLDKYEGKLSSEEEAAIQNALQQKRLRKLSVKMKKELSSGDSPVFNRYTSNTLPARTKSNGTSKKIKKSKQTQNKITITSSLSFETNTTSEPVEKNNSLGKEQEPKGPEIVVLLSSETVIAGRSIQLKCEIKSCVHPAPSITWLHDGIPLSIDRAFTNCGEKMCVLKINDVQRSDEGQYTCNISNKMGLVTSTATLTVLSHPEAPGQPRVRPLSSSSVALSWDAPLYTGNSTITLYLVECKDTLSDKWSTIMKRITEPSAMIDDLVPGSEYVFRVIAGNQIGSSEPSAESVVTQMASPPLSSEFSLEQFDGNYELLDEIGRIPGVNVFEFFSSRDSVSEAETAVAIGQVVCALCYLHQANIAHLDIKPENVMAVEIGESNVPEIKLVHFERSRKLLPDTDVIVTRLYEEIDFEVPEVLLGQPVSMETDMWSLGAVLYTLLTGSSPFLVDSQDLTKENIVKGRVSFPSKTFKNISGKAKDLLTQLLVVNKSKRLSSSKCQSHAWLNQPPSNTLDLHKLRDYMSSRKWQNIDNLKTSSYTLL